MAIEARIRELGARHKTLERVIEEEARLPAADSLHVNELKRKRLQLKDEIDVLRAARAQ